MEGVEGNRVLLLMGPSLHLRHNHRSRHLTRYARQTFVAVDVVGDVGFYEGPPTNVLRKALAGTKAFLGNRRRESIETRGTEITLRSMPLPFHLKIMASDLWLYVYLRQTCRKRYRLCIFGDPRIALMAVLLKYSGMVETLVYEDWDYFPGMLSVARNRFGSQVLEWRERIAVRSADMVICVSRPLARLRQKQGASRVEVVPNGVDYDLFAQAQLKNAHPPTLIYMGALSQLWGADLPIRALPSLRQSIPNLRYVLVGRGADEMAFRSLATDLGVQDLVSFVGERRYEELPHYLAEADIGIATSRVNEFRQYAFPLKLIEYMAAGLPVICTNVGDAEEVVREGNAGVVIGFERQALTDAVISLLGHPAEYAACSINAANFAKAYDWSTIFQREFSLIAGLL
jgi:glycosyltransferase involved in cell wall biosynthesis